MTEDRDFELLLRRYHPSEPPARLRERIVGVAVTRKESSTAWQLVAAAALLFIGVGFQAATARIDRRLQSESFRDFMRPPVPGDELNALLLQSDQTPELSLEDFLESFPIERFQ